jgi:hypothetical protein
MFLKLFFDGVETLPDPPDHIEQRVAKRSLGTRWVRPFVRKGSGEGTLKVIKREPD